MNDPFARLRRFLRELKRRNVYKVAVAYVAVAFVVLQGARLLVPALVLPEWFYRVVVALALLGFPLALIVAWAFEMSPEGMRRTPAATEAEEASESEAMAPEERRAQSRLAMKALVGLGLVGAAVAGGWYLMGGGGEPSAETGAPADTARTEARAGDRSIAVLPFEALGESEPGTFTEGMHDALLTRLSNVSGLKVVSRTSVQQYRNTDKTTAEIARELGVKWVVEGGVQEMGDQIQVNAQLIDPRTDTHAWADSYRRSLTAEDLFTLQTEITKKIAQSLEAQLTLAEEERIARQPTGDLEAYKLYVQGRRLLARRTAASIDSGKDYFQRALQKDSTYALAWAGLAEAELLYIGYSSAPGTNERAFRETIKGVLPDAQAAARRALKLNSDLAEGHASLGLVYLFEQLQDPRVRNGPRALHALKRALELKPSYAQAHQYLGLWQRDLGRPAPALQHYRLAVELDPEHYAARRSLVGILIANGEYEEALAEAHRLQERYPGRPGGTAVEAAALAHLERWEAVQEAVRPHTSETARALLWASTLLAVADVKTGDTAAARSRLPQLRVGEDERPPFAVALVEAALGNKDAALSALDERVLRHAGFYGYTSLIPRSGVQGLRYFFPEVLSSVRDDSQYRELIRELNRAWGLNPDGSLPDSVDVSFEDPSND